MLANGLSQGLVASGPVDGDFIAAETESVYPLIGGMLPGFQGAKIPGPPGFILYDNPVQDLSPHIIKMKFQTVLE